ncbi:hypothetical protein Nmel_002548 [Mimus melanotis]
MLLQIFIKANSWKTILSQLRYVSLLLSIVQTPIRSSCFKSKAPITVTIL